MTKNEIGVGVLFAADYGVIHVATARRHYFIVQVVELFNLLSLLLF